MREEFYPVCSPQLLKGPAPLRDPADLTHHTLPHDEATVEWRTWLLAAGVECVDAERGWEDRSTTDQRCGRASSAAVSGPERELLRSLLARPGERGRDRLALVAPRLHPGPKLGVDAVEASHLLNQPRRGGDHLSRLRGRTLHLGVAAGVPPQPHCLKPRVDALRARGLGERGADGPGPRQWAGSGHSERARGCGVEPARVRRRCPCAVSAAVFTSGEVGENRLDEFGSLDASDDAQSGAALGTALDVDAKDGLEPLRPAQRGSGRMEVALGGVSRVGGDVVTARPHAPHHLAVVRKRLATSLPRHRETGHKYQPLTCRRHPDNATYTRSPIRIGQLFFLYVRSVPLRRQYCQPSRMWAEFQERPRVAALRSGERLD